jgi:hypothetical protein
MGWNWLHVIENREKNGDVGGVVRTLLMRWRLGFFV